METPPDVCLDALKLQYMPESPAILSLGHPVLTLCACHCPRAVAVSMSLMPDNPPPPAVRGSFPSRRDGALFALICFLMFCPLTIPTIRGHALTSCIVRGSPCLRMHFFEPIFVFFPYLFHRGFVTAEITRRTVVMPPTHMQQPMYLSSLCASNMLECVQHDLGHTCVPSPNAHRSCRKHTRDCRHTLHVGL